MKVVLVGYGRMGKEVEQILVERGHQVALRVDSTPGLADAAKLEAPMLRGVDGVIEFSLTAAVRDNAAVYAAARTPAVVGTTGWESQRDEIRGLIAAAGGAYLHGSNFSIGAHLMFALVARAAELIKPFDDYDVMVHEFHHKLKADSPSGTALSIAELILDKLPRKTAIQTQALDRPIRPEELHVSSTRGGAVPGIHSVMLDSLADTIEITHTVRSRRGLALGSVLALEWLVGKTGFYRVEDFVASLMGS